MEDIAELTNSSLDILGLREEVHPLRMLNSKFIDNWFEST